MQAVKQEKPGPTITHVDGVNHFTGRSSPCDLYGVLCTPAKEARGCVGWVCIGGCTRVVVTWPLCPSGLSFEHRGTEPFFPPRDIKTTNFIFRGPCRNISLKISLLYIWPDRSFATLLKWSCTILACLALAVVWVIAIQADRPRVVEEKHTCLTHHVLVCALSIQ